uniref:Si:ch211-243a20.3 n=1 Tax=Echeneis naucrates TaxID=173247 RepID=A0A665X0U6_ECHNA
MLSMAPSSRLLLLMVVATVTGGHAASEENELDYGYWNYREGADSVNVASVRSVTRVLDAWGKRIFNEIKTLLHSQPSTLLPDYSRVRPLSESVNDLFREVSLLRRRITELSHRLATLEPFLRHHGYRGAGEEVAPAPQSLRGKATSLDQHPLRTTTRARISPPRGSRVLSRRRVRQITNLAVDERTPSFSR